VFFLNCLYFHVPEEHGIIKTDVIRVIVGLKEVLDVLGSIDFVKAAHVLEGEFYDRVMKEEGSVKECAFGMPFVNRALEEVCKRTVSLCLFTSGNFEDVTEHIMILEDAHGNIVGHDVPKCMADDFKDNEDIIWLSEDFALYTSANLFKANMVMLPNNAKFIGENEGVKDPVMLYPATTTDILLKEHFGVSVNERIWTAILAFDIL